MRSVYHYESGNQVGNFDGKDLYNLNGDATHYLLSTYLYNHETGDSDFYIHGKYIYSERTGNCVMYFG